MLALCASSLAETAQIRRLPSDILENVFSFLRGSEVELRSIADSGIITRQVAAALFEKYNYNICRAISASKRIEELIQKHSLPCNFAADFLIGGAIFDSVRLEKIGIVYDAIRQGADGFLFAEYSRCLAFMVGFAGIVLVLTSRVREDCERASGNDGSSCAVHWEWKKGGLTAVAFLVGALTSIACGFLGMKVAVFSNARTTISCADRLHPYEKGFNTSFRAGSVVGFSLIGITLISLYILLVCFNRVYPFADNVELFECITGFGLGGSAVALFGRVGGGIFTKAADVGADLAGKVVSGIPEDDYRNPGVISDNVGKLFSMHFRYLPTIN